MIVIFLDIDGVLLVEAIKFEYGGIPSRLEKRYIEQGLPKEKFDLSAKACDAEAVNLFYKSALENLNALITFIEKSGESAGIVISSSWRQDRSVSELKKLFFQHSFSNKIIDKTADNIYIVDRDIDFEHSLNRGEEIEIWLQENREKYNVSNFVILDDVDSGIKELFKQNFIKCDNEFFDKNNLQQAIDALDSKSYLETKHQDYPINKFSLKIYNNSKCTELAEKFLRLTSGARRNFVLAFFRSNTSLSEKIKSDNTKTCAELIEDFDLGERTNQSTCCIM